VRAFKVTDHIKAEHKETCIAHVNGGKYGRKREEACTKYDNYWLTDRRGLEITGIDYVIRKQK